MFLSLSHKFLKVQSASIFEIVNLLHAAHVLATANQFMLYDSWGGFVCFDSSRVSCRVYVQEAAQSLCRWETISISPSPLCLPAPLSSKSMRVFPKLKPRSKLKTTLPLLPLQSFLGLNRWRRHNFLLCYISHCLLATHTHTPHAHPHTHTPRCLLCSCCCLFCFFGAGFCLCLVTFPLLLPWLQFTPHVLLPPPSTFLLPLFWGTIWCLVHSHFVLLLRLPIDSEN